MRTKPRLLSRRTLVIPWMIFIDIISINHWLRIFEKEKCCGFQLVAEWRKKKGQATKGNSVVGWLWG